MVFMILVQFRFCNPSVYLMSHELGGRNGVRWRGRVEKEKERREKGRMGKRERSRKERGEKERREEWRRGERSGKRGRGRGRENEGKGYSRKVQFAHLL